MPRTVICPLCEDEYQSIGQHWVTSRECDFPPIDEHKALILELAAASGYVWVPNNSPNALPRIVLYGSRDDLKIWERELEWLACSIRPVTNAGGTNRFGGEIPADASQLEVRSHPYNWRFVEDRDSEADEDPTEYNKSRYRGKETTELGADVHDLLKSV